MVLTQTLSSTTGFNTDNKKYVLSKSVYYNDFWRISVTLKTRVMFAENSALPSLKYIEIEKTI